MASADVMPAAVAAAAAEVDAAMPETSSVESGKPKAQPRKRTASTAQAQSQSQTNGSSKAAPKAAKRARSTGPKAKPASKPKSGAKPKVKIASKPMFDDSSSDDSSDSSSDSSSDGDDSSSDAGEEEGGGGAGAPASSPTPAPAPKPTAAAVAARPKPGTKRPATKPAPAPKTKTTPTPKPKPKSPSPPPIRDDAGAVLTTEKRKMTGTAIDELVPLILNRSREGGDDGKVLVVSSLKMQAVLSRLAHRRSEISEDNVHTLLGITPEQVDKADAVVFVVHGPHTEEEMTAARLYEARTLENYHWSLACWFRAHKHTFHYDSQHPINTNRCAEVLGAMRHLGVLPRNVSDISAPRYFPQQGQDWECGYAALIALTIIADQNVPSPINEDDATAVYATHFASLSKYGANGFFLQHLRDLVAGSKY